jgi:hypothetical protein
MDNDISLPLINLNIIHYDSNNIKYNKCNKLINKVNNLLNNENLVKFYNHENLVKFDLQQKQINFNNYAFVCITDEQLKINNNSLFINNLNKLAELCSVSAKAEISDPDDNLQNIANNALNDLKKKNLPIGCSILYSNNYNIIFTPIISFKNNNYNLNKINNLYYAIRAILWNITSYNYIQTILKSNKFITDVYIPIIYNQFYEDINSNEFDNNIYNLLKQILKAFLEYSKRKKIINFTCKKKKLYYYNFLPINDIEFIKKQQL